MDRLKYFTDRIKTVVRTANVVQVLETQDLKLLVWAWTFMDLRQCNLWGLKLPSVSLCVAMIASTFRQLKLSYIFLLLMNFWNLLILRDFLHLNVLVARSVQDFKACGKIVKQLFQIFILCFFYILSSSRKTFFNVTCWYCDMWSILYSCETELNLDI